MSDVPEIASPGIIALSLSGNDVVVWGRGSEPR